MSRVRRLCLWSGPRNVSTAVMYAFAQRNDTRVVDEPLYAHYLTVSGAQHPGREDVLAAQDSDARRVIREVILGPCDRPNLFIKQMAHHMAGIDPDFMAQTENAFLIRDPVEMLPSLVKQVPEPDLSSTGLGWQADLHRRLLTAGKNPVVVDARLLLLDPEGVLSELCEGFGIQFDEAMLSWPAGARPEDGVWAPHWYENVHASNGFEPYRPKQGPFPSRLEPLLSECRPCYEYLYRFAVH